MDKDCKECLNSRLIVSENGYEAICTLSIKKSKICLFNDKCYFKGSLLYLMTRPERGEEE